MRLGHLLTAFLERFFERYVAFEFTAGMEDELDDVSGGRTGWQQLLEAFWKDFKPKAGEVMDQQPSEITAALANGSYQVNPQEIANRLVALVELQGQAAFAGQSPFLRVEPTAKQIR